MSEEVKEAKAKATKADKEAVVVEAEEVIELEVIGAFALVFGGKISKFGDTIVVTEGDLEKQSFIHLFTKGQVEFKNDASRTRKFIAEHGGLLKQTYSQPEEGPEYK